MEITVSAPPPDVQEAIDDLREWSNLQLRIGARFESTRGAKEVFGRFLYIEGKERRDFLFKWFIETHNAIVAIEEAPLDMPHQDALGYRPFVMHTLYERDMVWRKDAARWFPLPETTRQKQDVYFLRAGSDGPIKIGIAQNTVQRMRNLQCGCAWPIEVLGKIEGGGRSLESKLHKQFASIRMSGEWFEPRREIIEYIEANAS